MGTRWDRFVPSVTSESPYQGLRDLPISSCLRWLSKYVELTQGLKHVLLSKICTDLRQLSYSRETGATTRGGP